MIFLDTRVVLAQLLAEDRQPSSAIWSETLVASRLLEYEVRTRVHARGLAKTRDEAVRGVLARLAFVERARPVLARALEPFPRPVRTHDALHLASIDFLRQQGQLVRLASYDARLLEMARAMKVPLLAM